MRDDDHGHESSGGRLARAGVLLFSGTVAAVLILNSGPGCDGPKTEATKPASAQQAAQPTTPPATPPATQPATPTPAPQPVPSAAPAVPPDSKIGPGTDGLVRPNAANNAGNPGNDPAIPRYFPASKAGVFIDPAARAEPPASEPAVQQNAPPQQAPQPQKQGK